MKFPLALAFLKAFKSNYKIKPRIMIYNVMANFCSISFFTLLNFIAQFSMQLVHLINSDWLERFFEKLSRTLNSFDFR